MKFLTGLLSAACLAAACSAAELRPLPWSERLNTASRFDHNSSGRLTISNDAAEKAVRFDVEFKPGTDFWCYPGIRFGADESLADVEAIRFDIKAVQPELKPEWQTVTVRVPETAADPAAVKSIRIGANPRSEKTTFYIRNLEMLSSKPPKGGFDAASTITVHAPGSVFVQGEPLTFSLKPYAALPLRWKLLGWNGEVLRSGEWPGSGREELRLPALPNGYYQLAVESAETPFPGVRSFAVVPDPASRLRNPDTFFAIDSGQSWLGRPDPANPVYPGDAYELLSELIRRGGIESVRTAIDASPSGLMQFLQAAFWLPELLTVIGVWSAAGACRSRGAQISTGGLNCLRTAAVFRIIFEALELTFLLIYLLFYSAEDFFSFHFVGEEYVVFVMAAGCALTIVLQGCIIAALNSANEAAVKARATTLPPMLLAVIVMAEAAMQIIGLAMYWVAPYLDYDIALQLYGMFGYLNGSVLLHMFSLLFSAVSGILFSVVTLRSRREGSAAMEAE